MPSKEPAVSSAFCPRGVACPKFSTNAPPAFSGIIPASAVA